MLKKMLIFLTLAVLLTTFAACSSAKNSQTNASQEKAVLSGWDISVVDTKMNASLEDISTDVGYGGETSTNKISSKPSTGNSYLLVKMIAEKMEGTEVVDWDKMKVIDSNGNAYPRINDSFLEDYGFKRMKGTPLNFGNNEGWIAFEVNSAAKDFKINYTSDAGTLSINLALK